MSVFVVLIAAVVLVVAVVVGLCVVLASSRPNRVENPAVPTQTVTPAPSREERQAVLMKLAEGELTKQEAEEQLEMLGTPLPASVSAPPVARQGCGKGCLVGLLVGAVLLPLILVLILHLFLGMKVAGPSSTSVRFQDMPAEAELPVPRSHP